MTRVSGHPTGLGTLAWLAGLLVVAGVGVVGHLLTFTQLSRIDEYQHVDYLDRTLHLEHVNGGEQVEELAMREQACRGHGPRRASCCRRATRRSSRPSSSPGPATTTPTSTRRPTTSSPPRWRSWRSPSPGSTRSSPRPAGSARCGWPRGWSSTFLLARRLGADDAVRGRGERCCWRSRRWCCRRRRP